MSVAARINRLVLVIGLVALALVILLIAQGEYRHHREQLIAALSAEAAPAELATAVVLAQGETLEQTLRALVRRDRALRYARLLSPEGRVLASWQQTGQTSPPPDLRSVRDAELSPTETGVSGHPGDSGAPLAVALLAGGERMTDITLPVFAPINPASGSVDRQQLAAALANPASSRFVAAYLQLGISRAHTLLAVLPAIALQAALGALLVLGACLLITWYTRRLMAPLAQLASKADAINAGRLEEPVTVDGSGEIQEIASVLNAIIGGLNQYKSRIDVDHQLLSMKVQERTVQLSQRNEELSRAVRQVTETRDRLRQLAYFDSLTALPNRRLFTEQLDLLLRLARRNDELLALMFLDLDNFKRINDSLGHSAGDLLLKEVAQRLASCVRESDVVAHFVDNESRIDVSRLGGDEFTVVLNQVENKDAVSKVAQRLLNSLLQPITIDGHELVVTPSIGIAVAPQDADSIEGLLKAADTAMHQAKARGKNTFLFYDHSMDAESVDRLRLEADLRRALERDELLFHYQPQVDAETGTVMGVEALMRWQHPEQGMIPPFRFIPIAEEAGLIGEMGLWGIRAACRDIVQLRREGLHLPKVAVNVSALQFSSNFAERVRTILEETGASPDMLELELTESILVEDSNQILGLLRDLKQLGVRLSIDDFGTGYSSLSYLSRFPLDELKIDRSFVIDIDKSEADASLVSAIIAMGRSLNLELVAEGVETPEQFEFLTRGGELTIQGYLFSKPVELDALKPLLAVGHFAPRIRDVRAELAAAAPAIASP
ncbi:putative bifunctional diguanylate cyclase/phosphodiesterase [Haliea atlantica]